MVSNTDSKSGAGRLTNRSVSHLTVGLRMTVGNWPLRRAPRVEKRPHRPQESLSRRGVSPAMRPPKSPRLPPGISSARTIIYSFRLGRPDIC